MARCRLDHSLPSHAQCKEGALGLAQLLHTDHCRNRPGGEIARESFCKVFSQVQFHQPGSLRLGTSPIRMDEFKYALSRQVDRKIAKLEVQQFDDVPQGHKQSPAKLLTPEEVEELVPILNMEGVSSKTFNAWKNVFKSIDPWRASHPQ